MHTSKSCNFAVAELLFHVLLTMDFLVLNEISRKSKLIGLNSGVNKIFKIFGLSC